MVSRIKQLLDWQQLSPTQFADRIGVGRPVVSHILSERNKPSLEVMRSIKAAFPELSLDWLLNGSGAMLVAAATAAAGTAEVITPLAAARSVLDAPAAPGPNRLAPAAAPIPIEAPLPASAQAAAPREALVGASTALPVAAAPQLAAPVAPPARFRPSRSVLPALPTAIEEAPTPAATPLPGSASTSAPSPVSEAVAAPTAPPVPEAIPAPLPATEALAAPLAGPPAATQSLVASAAAWATNLAEPGKAIRRIVIFYHDGSFADYQPE